MCQSKNSSGLWLCKVLVKNRGLLNKWLWHYRNETNSLWRRVLCKKNDVDENSVLTNINNTKKLSTIWKDIYRPLSNINKFYEVVQSGFRVLNGDEKLASFWDDELIDGFILRIKFLKIYALTCKKTRIVFEFGAWVEEFWQWYVNLRK